MADLRFSSAYDVNRTLSDFKEKLKHGYHVIKILENQLETARQNISLLQGQIRLANETINNLKQHYSELDDGVSFVLNHKGASDNIPTASVKYNSNEVDGETTHVFHTRSNDIDRFHTTPTHKHFVTDTDGGRSPRPIIVVQKGGTVTVSEAEHPDKPRSPYAQQLKQVLEALQDDDPSKKNSIRISPTQQESLKDSTGSHCSCPDCVPSKPFIDHASCGKPGCSCGYTGSGDMHEKVQESLRSRLQDEDSVTWKHPLRIEHAHQSLDSPSNGNVSGVPSSSHSISHSSEPSTPVGYQGHCQGACCSNEHDVGHTYKVVEKGSGIMHYVPVSSPGSDITVKRDSVSSVQSAPLPGHCDDKCKCHAFVNYARYGYQLVESAPGIPQSIQPISPNSSRRVKRPPPPLLPGDEPPHLKYTKVKRIDGSKLTAQKTIADFSKRRFHPYNPRYDLDLLIVPPPVPASELLNIAGCTVDDDVKSTALSKEGSVSSSASEDGSTTTDTRYIAGNTFSKSRINSENEQEVQKYQVEIVQGESDCLSRTDVLNRNTITHDSNGTAISRVVLKTEHVFGSQWSPTSHRQDVSPSQRSGKFDNFQHIHGNHSVKLPTSKMSQLDNVLHRAETKYEQNGISPKLQDTVGKAF